MPLRPISSPRRPGAGKSKTKPSASQPALDYADTLLYQLQLSGLPQPEREFMFHRRRKWRFDLAWLSITKPL